VSRGIKHFSLIVPNPAIANIQLCLKMVSFPTHFQPVLRFIFALFKAKNIPKGAGWIDSRAPILPVGMGYESSFTTRYGGVLR
jgi:hypothetical protein